MKTFARIATVFYIIAVPVFLVTANVRFVAGDSAFYKSGFRRHDAVDVTQVSLPQLDAAADDLVRYFEDDRSVLRIPVTINDQQVSLFNEKETSHMRDVKTLIRLVFRLNEISLAVIIAYVGAVVLWSRERSLRDLARYSLMGVGLGAVFVGVIGVFAITGFDAAWSQFHRIVFRNNDWILDPRKDRLIQMFPEPFWQEMTYLVGGLTLLEAFAVVSASISYMVFGREKASKSKVPAAPSARRQAS
ncbi:MAG: TIGR01906 family membrane protein [bacterium]